MRVLIISEFFYPSSSIGGKRPTRLAKYLTKMGDTVDVVCPHRRYLKNTDEAEDPGEAKIYGTFFMRFGHDAIFGREHVFRCTLLIKMSAFFSKIMARFFRLIQVPDRSMLWIPIAVAKSLRVIKKFQPDVIYVSCPEYGANVAGAIVQRITRIPLVIDYDDPWHIPYNQPNLLQRLLNRKIEEFTLKCAKHAIASTKEMADEIKGAFSHIRAARSCYGIHSSFLPCKNDSFYTSDPKVGLNLIHAGNIYEGRNAKTLVQAMLEFSKDPTAKGLPIPTFTSYGKLDNVSKQILAKNSGMDMLFENSFIPYTDCMKKLSAADVLVLFVAPEHWCQIPGKFFDYISCNRPVLAFAGPGRNSVERVVNETGTGWVILNGDIETTKSLLYELSDKKAKGKSIKTTNTHMLKLYHRSEELRQLREVLISACKYT